MKIIVCGLTLGLAFVGATLAGCNPRGPSAPAAELSGYKDEPRRGDPRAGRDPNQTPAPLREARIGPHRMKIPANYFENQMGPEHDGSFALYLEYPSLEPFAPGARRPISLDILARQVDVSPDFVRSDVNTLLSRTLEPGYAQPGDPRRNLESRLRGARLYGLEPYYTDIDAVAAYAVATGSKPDYMADPHSLFNDDWYVRRDEHNELVTVIKCTSRAIKDDAVIFDGHQFRRNVDSDGRPSCRHDIVVPEFNISVTMYYARAFLRDWERIEDHARALIADFHQGTIQQTKE